MDRALNQHQRGDAEWGPPGTQPASVATTVRIEDVHHSYGQAAAVRGVSLRIEPGEIVCLLGRAAARPPFSGCWQALSAR
jgi:ABC-type multidrug transport system fused ATPase/permease subunit